MAGTTACRDWSRKRCKRRDKGIYDLGENITRIKQEQQIHEFGLNRKAFGQVWSITANTITAWYSVILRYSSIIFCIFWMSLKISATVKVHARDCSVSTSRFLFPFFKAHLLTKNLSALTTVAVSSLSGHLRYGSHSSLLLRMQCFIWSLQWHWEHTLLSLDTNKTRQRSCLCPLQDKRESFWLRPTRN